MTTKQRVEIDLTQDIVIDPRTKGSTITIEDSDSEPECIATSKTQLLGDAVNTRTGVTDGLIDTKGLSAPGVNELRPQAQPERVLLGGTTKAQSGSLNNRRGFKADSRAETIALDELTHNSTQAQISVQNGALRQHESQEFDQRKDSTSQKPKERAGSQKPARAARKTSGMEPARRRRGLSESPIKRVMRTYSETSVEVTPSTTNTPAAANSTSILPAPAVSEHRCAECIESDVQCDGEKPCSRCVEPGFRCTYGSESSLSLLEELEESRAEQAEARSLDMLMEREHGSPSITARTSSRAEQPGIVGLQMRSRPSAIDAAQREHLPESAWRPRNASDTAKLVDLAQSNLYQHREYWLQGELLRAKKIAQQTPTCPSPSPSSKVNPWRSFLADRKNDNTTPDGGIKLQLKAKLEKSKPVIIPYTTLVIPSSLPMPVFKSIGRMGHNFLSRNVRTLKHMPYFPETAAADNDDDDDSSEGELNSKDKEILKRKKNESKEEHTFRKREFRRAKAFDKKYRNRTFKDPTDRFNSELTEQKQCFERRLRWSNSFEQLCSSTGIDVKQFRQFLDSRIGQEKCRVCKLYYRKPPFLFSIVSLSQEETQQCQWLYDALKKTVGIGPWHFVEPNHAYRTDKPDLQVDVQRKAEGGISLCAICFVPNCLMHGAYIDDLDDENVKGVHINDPEQESNRRIWITNGDKTDVGEHVCGLFCVTTDGVDPLEQLRELYGVDRDGWLTGLRNEDVEIRTELLGFKGTNLCKNCCFIVQQYRPDRASRSSDILKGWQRKFLRSTARLFGAHYRLPCFLAEKLKIPCMDAFVHLVEAHHQPPHNIELLPTDPQKGRQVGKVRDNYTANADEHKLNEQRPFVPCSHTGPCLAENGCRCVQDRISCDWLCGCDKSCRRRYGGCKCRGTCFADERCLCWQLNRECDPWLCKSCGVLEVLDPVNKYNPAVREGRCRNNMIQLGLPARTVKGLSEYQGWGLFAGEDMPENTFLGEYKGEINTDHESERRAVIHKNGGLEYLFRINIEQDIDGMNFGNKTRFMNNEKDRNLENLMARTTKVNGTTRVMFYTTKPLLAGTELVYNYHMPEKVAGTFWGKNEVKPKKGLIPVPRARTSGVGLRISRLANTKPKKDKQPLAKSNQRGGRGPIEDEEEEGSGHEMDSNEEYTSEVEDQPREDEDDEELPDAYNPSDDDDSSLTSLGDGSVDPNMWHRPRNVSKHNSTGPEAGLPEADDHDGDYEEDDGSSPIVSDAEPRSTDDNEEPRPGLSAKGRPLQRQMRDPTTDRRRREVRERLGLETLKRKR